MSIQPALLHDTLGSYWNNLLIQKFLELGKIRISKVHRKLRSPVNRSRIRPLSSNDFCRYRKRAVSNNGVIILESNYCAFLTENIQEHKSFTRHTCKPSNINQSHCTYPTNNKNGPNFGTIAIISAQYSTIKGITLARFLFFVGWLLLYCL